MPRLRLYDCRNSRLPSLVGLCTADTPGIANFVNAAQRRLLMCREAGDEGWWGTWAEMSFSMLSCLTPHIVCPREVARIEKIDICKRPVPIHGQFYEFLDFGNGRMPNLRRFHHWHVPQGYTRNNTPTFVDLTNPPQIIRIYATDPADINGGRRVLLQGNDPSGAVIYSQDGFNQVTGIYVDVASPFADCPVQFSSITGIQKDATSGPIQIFQVDPVSGAQILLVTMEPTEQVASYRRYYFNSLPRNCCFPPGPVTNLQVNALVKLDLIPVVTDPDYCLIQNLEAITEECQSIRLSEIDSEKAKKMAAERHIQAIRMLNGELVHYYGKTTADVNFAPFGSARLEHQGIGTQI